MLSATAKKARTLVYVPNSAANTVQVIDPTTFRVIASYPTGGQPQHVVPSCNLNATQTPGAMSAGQGMRMAGARSNLMPGASAMPQDVRFTPDGTRFLVVWADARNGSIS